MKCYSEKDGSKFQLCQKRLGYRTCFAQYDKGKVSDSSSERKEKKTNIFRGRSSAARMFNQKSNVPR